VAHHSLAATSLGPGSNVLSAKERTGCWLSIELLDVVIGVDTHTAAAVGAMGAALEHLTVPTDPAG
jgi:hypothetical protein